MKLKNNQIPITIEEYKKKMDKLLEKYQCHQIDEAVVAFLEEACKYTIVKPKRAVSRKGKK